MIGGLARTGNELYASANGRPRPLNSRGLCYDQSGLTATFEILS